MTKAEPTIIKGFRIKLRTLSDLDKHAKKRKRSRNFIINEAIESTIYKNIQNEDNESE